MTTHCSPLICGLRCLRKKIGYSIMIIIPIQFTFLGHSVHKLNPLPYCAYKWLITWLIEIFIKEWTKKGETRIKIYSTNYQTTKGKNKNLYYAYCLFNTFFSWGGIICIFKVLRIWYTFPNCIINHVKENWISSYQRSNLQSKLHHVCGDVVINCQICCVNIFVEKIAEIN